MIIVNFFGGLGNQMFQFAFAYALAKKLKRQLIFNNTLQKLFKVNHNTKKLNLLFKINFLREEKDSYLIKYYKKILLRFPHLSLFTKKYCTDYNFHKFNFNRKSFEILGYWQNNFFLKKDKYNFKKIFFFKKKNISSKYRNTVSIHIRRNDYLDLKSIYHQCDLKYYSKAINFMKKRIKNPKFILFTDDRKWSKRKFLNKFPFIKLSSIKNSEVEDMYEMSLCEHNIISNSTFSWWGAKLNSNKTKIVIYPSKWFKNKKSPDIFDNSWYKIN